MMRDDELDRIITATDDRRSRNALLERIGWVVAVVSASLAVAIAGLSMMVTLSDKNDVIDNLEDQLACREVYTAAVDAAKAEYLITIGELVEVIATGGPNRAEAIVSTIDRLAVARDGYRGAVQERVAFEDAPTVECIEP